MSDPRNIFFDQRGETKEEDKTAATAAPTQPEGESEIQNRIGIMKELASKYQKAGEGQLITDIINNVIEQKARGQLTNEQLMQFAKRVSPLLNNEQKERLNGLLEQLLKL
jgi:hypothetical protein